MMNKSENITKISAALVKAQKNIEAAIKKSYNPHFRSKYANLSAVIDACKESLNNEGIAILQYLHSEGTDYFVTTELRHESSEFFSATVRLIFAKNDMQSLLASCTYAKRGQLESMVGLPSEDDDGNTAMGRDDKSKSAQKNTNGNKDWNSPPSSPADLKSSPATAPLSNVQNITGEKPRASEGVFKPDVSEQIKAKGKHIKQLMSDLNLTKEDLYKTLTHLKVPTDFTKMTLPQATQIEEMLNEELSIKQKNEDLFSDDIPEHIKGII